MRARARWGITPLLAAPAGAWALGLGDIELQSALNQPFRAEIALSATTDEMQGLRVTLAGDDMFERRGLDRPAFLDSLEFRVVADRNGRNVIQISSRESIAEPFVTLFVEATWPRGRNVKEYTVLLDPPVFLPAPGRSARGAAGRNAFARATTRPAVRSTARDSSDPRPRPPARHRRRPSPAGARRFERGAIDAARPASATGGPMVPCNAPRLCGRSPTDCAPTASRSIR